MLLFPALYHIYMVNLYVTVCYMTTKQLCINQRFPGYPDKNTRLRNILVFQIIHKQHYTKKYY